LEQIDVWFPTDIKGTAPYRGNPIVARLRPGSSVDQANAEMQTFVPRFAREQPEAYAGGNVRFTARLLHVEMTRDARPALFFCRVRLGLRS
jgi:hypothetical protein